MKLSKRHVALPLMGVAAALAAATAFASPAIAEGGKAVVQTVPVEDARGAEEILSGEGATIVDPTDYTSDTSTLKSTSSQAVTQRPASFDLRACDLDGDGELENYVTLTKNQNPFGTCWTFGSSAAAEASILAELGVGTPAGTPNANLDISEKALAWFVKNPQVSGSQAGEGIYTGTEDPTSKFSGGWISTATSSYAMGNGPIAEAMDPVLEYHNNSDVEQVSAGHLDAQYLVLPLDRLTPEMREQMQIGDDWALDVWMQANPAGDWSVPEDFRGIANWELEETYYLPSPASFVDTANPDVKIYKYNQAGVDAIKDQLLAGRGVGIGFCADTSQPNQPNVAHYMNPATFAHYTYESPKEGEDKGGQTNHAVCIVGYDDTYSRTNFNAEHRPPGDGAFIVKNSWGGNDVDDPRNYNPWGIDGEGYFYLSYYDKSIQMPEAFDFITAADDDATAQDQAGTSTYTLYQYAFLPNDPTGTNYDSTTSYANVYTMAEDSVIRDVSTQTYSFDADVRFDIYLLRDGATEPSDGTLLWSHEETYPYGGYHRVEIDEPLSVKAGQKVGVICTTELPNGKFEVINNQGQSQWSHDLQYADPTQGYWYKAIVNPGESFVGSPSTVAKLGDGTSSFDGYTWVDYTEMIAENQEKAQAAVDAAGIEQLKVARDDAYAKLNALAQDDPARADAQKAYDAAQDALSDASDSIMDTTARALFYAQDNFPLHITTAADASVYRLYNPNTGEHLYTADANEKDVLSGEHGWRYEDVAWASPATSATPVYRLRNVADGEHLYTADANERAELLRLPHWRDEGIAFYSDPAEGVAVYRLYNPLGSGPDSHLYTMSENERDVLSGERGWSYEDVAWYGKA